MNDRVRNVFKGKVLRLNLERVTLPNGQTTELEIAHHPGGAVIVALDADNRVCLLRQYRHATGGWITELPAGKLDNNEDPLLCAQRELAEEAGVTARRWDKLGDFYSSPGVLTEVIHVYLARDLAAGDLSPEAHEVLRRQLGAGGRSAWNSQPPAGCRTPRASSGWSGPQVAARPGPVV